MANFKIGAGKVGVDRIGIAGAVAESPHIPEQPLQAPQRRGIGSTAIPPNTLLQLFNATVAEVIFRRPLIANTPQKHEVRADVFPNLLLSTFAATPEQAPFWAVDFSAHQAKANVQSHIPPNLLATLYAETAGEPFKPSLFAAPPGKREVYADVFQSPLSTLYAAPVDEPFRNHLHFHAHQRREIFGNLPPNLQCSTLFVAPGGFKAAWASRSNIVIGGGYAT
jgi:hypothetical protein